MQVGIEITEWIIDCTDAAQSFGLGSTVLLGVMMICLSRHLVLGQLYGRL